MRRSGLSGTSEPPCSPLGFRKSTTLLKTYRQIRHDNHLRDPLSGADNTCRLTVIVKCDDIIAPVVGVAYARAGGRAKSFPGCDSASCIDRGKIAVRYLELKSRVNLDRLMRRDPDRRIDRCIQVISCRLFTASCGNMGQIAHAPESDLDTAGYILHFLYISHFVSQPHAFPAASAAVVASTSHLSFSG